MLSYITNVKNENDFLYKQTIENEVILKEHTKFHVDDIISTASIFIFFFWKNNIYSK